MKSEGCSNTIVDVILKWQIQKEIDWGDNLLGMEPSCLEIEIEVEVT